MVGHHNLGRYSVDTFIIKIYSGEKVLWRLEKEASDEAEAYEKVAQDVVKAS